MSFDEALDFYKKGQFDEALNCLNDSTRDNLLRSNILSEKSQNYKALELAEQCLKESIEKSDSFLEFGSRVALARSIGFFGINKWDECLVEIERAENIYGELSDVEQDDGKGWLTDTWYEKGTLFQLQIYDKDISQKLLDKAHESYREISDYRGMSKALNIQFWNYLHYGNFETAKSTVNQSLEISEKWGISSAKSYSQTLFGFLDLFSGNLDGALEQVKEALDLSIKIKNNWTGGYAAIGLGMVQINRGGLHQARDSFEQAIGMAEEIGDKHIEAMSRMNLGDIFYKQGDLEMSIKQLGKSKDINENLKDVNCFIDVNLRLGNLYRVRGQFTKAYEHFLQGYTSRYWHDDQSIDPQGIKLPDNFYSFPDSVYSLTLASLELDQIEEAKNYNQIFEAYNKKYSTDRSEYQKMIVDAMILKNSKRAKHKIQSQDMFEELIKKQTTANDLTIFVILNYCELLLIELQT
ncbi:MAG: tetratricopeptide repeat protein, partial [Candidatus Kariarchaeaceae archaeon]